MHYRWEIKTGTTWYAGTDANVYLSLRGDKASMAEIELNDPDDVNDWEKGDVNHGTIDTADLGNVQTGTLKHDGGGASPDWTPEYVRITNDEDGRVWLAAVNVELTANQVQRLNTKTHTFTRWSLPTLGCLAGGASCLGYGLDIDALKLVADGIGLGVGRGLECRAGDGIRDLGGRVGGHQAADGACCVEPGPDLPAKDLIVFPAGWTPTIALGSLDVSGEAVLVDRAPFRRDVGE